MNGDFTRSTFRKEKHYTSVRMQQGRVQVDADWNEALDIGLHLDRVTRRDVIGADGVPKEGGGFAIGVAPGGADLTISSGRMYVDGVLCEVDGEGAVLEEAHTDRVVVAALAAGGRAFEEHEWIEATDAAASVSHRARITAIDEAARSLMIDPPLAQSDADALNAAPSATVHRVASYATQPDLPEAPYVDAGTSPPALDLDDGTYVVYADVWERHVTALDDPELVETALGGPDTTTRTKAVWQVRMEPATGSPKTCDDLKDWAPGQGRTPTTGALRARSKPETPSTNPCVIPASAGYRRLENQLYRVEVHAPGPLGTATFKWSRDNASMAALWTAQAGPELTVSTIGPDEVLGFASGQLVELLDDTRELSGTPGSLTRIVAPPQGDVITVDTTVPVDRTQFPGNPKVRRWDCTNAAPVERPAAGDGWLALEDGVQVLFEDGYYNTGDYWLVPARTAQGDVEWPRDGGGAPVPRPPDGIAHHYAPLALIEVAGGTVTVLDDCRDPFPALSELTASDVAFDNAQCEIPGALTVQDALDAMCEHGGLRRHNRHLHGWGIVCGLQVVCGPHSEDRRASVTVRDGYAIDPEGNDLMLDEDRTLDVLDMIARLEKESGGETGVLDESGDGEVCLRLDVDPDRADLGFAIEPYDPSKEEDDLKAALQGTLLLDFYQECVAPVEKFFREELGEGRSDDVRSPRERGPSPRDRAPSLRDRADGGAGAARERRSILVALLAHILDQQAGHDIYMAEREHEILLGFYERLKALLQSETYCGMFDRARPFPDYPLAKVPMDTIFGVGNHTRIRLRQSPRGAGEAYTVGPGLNPLKPSTTINRYDLDNRVLMAQIDPISGADARDSLGEPGTDAVRDIAFSADGKRIYAIMPTRSGRDTFFRTGTIGDDGITWGRLDTICGVRLVTLATTEADPAHVYALGVDKGIYRIDPNAIDASADPFIPFEGAGALVVTPDGRAVATKAAGSSWRWGQGRYDAIAVYSLPDGSEVFPHIELPDAGRDDIAVATGRDGAGEDTVYVVVGSGSRRLVRVSLESGEVTSMEADLGETDVSLQVFAPTSTLVVGLEDGYCLQLLDLASNEMVADYLLPVQVGPASIAADPVRGIAYVLNDVSNTITVAPAEVLDPGFRFPYDELAEYRADVLEALVDLTAGFLQYLKDCFCHHLLVDCPEPTGDEKIYLACVSVRGNEVYKVCNFAKRRYVKSWPTMAYWISAIPIAPFIDRMVEAFCCAALPDTFGRFQAQRYVRSGDASDRQPRMSRAKPSSVRSGVFAVQAFDPLKQWSDLLAKARVAGMQAFPMFAQWAGGKSEGEVTDEPTSDKPAPSRGRPTAHVLYARNADFAQDKFESQGFEVERRPVTEMQGRDLPGILKATWRAPRADEKVVLYEEEGVVKGMTVVPLETPAAPVTARAPGPTDETLVQPAVRDEELIVLKERLVEMERKHEALLEAVSPERMEAPQQEVSVLKERLEEMERKHETLLEAVAPEKIEALESQVRKLRDLGIITPEGEAGPGRIVRRPTKPEE
jgi:hypothetical protein